MPSLECYERSLVFAGWVSIEFGGIALRLNMAMPHERRYLLRHLFGCRYPQADIDTLLFKRYLRQGDVILDAGANIGVTAIEAMNLGAKSVICVEPEPTLASRLRDLNHPGLTIHECALGDRDGDVELFLSTRHNQGHTIDPLICEQFQGLFDGSSVCIQLRTLESVIGDLYCDIWKLDVEGAEVDLVRASLGLIASRPPRVIISEIYGERLWSILELLSPRYECKRAFVRKDDYSLDLLSPNLLDYPENYHLTSPMFVFLDRQALGESPAVSGGAL